MDVLGLDCDEFPREQSESVAHLCQENFKNAFAEGTRHKPETTLGNVKPAAAAIEQKRRDTRR